MDATLGKSLDFLPKSIFPAFMMWLLMKKSGNWGLDEIDCHRSHKGQCTSNNTFLHSYENVWKKNFGIKIFGKKLFFPKYIAPYASGDNQFRRDPNFQIFWISRKRNLEDIRESIESHSFIHSFGHIVVLAEIVQAGRGFYGKMLVRGKWLRIWVKWGDRIFRSYNLPGQ